MKIRQYGITPNPNRVSSFDKQCGALSWTYRVGVGGSVYLHERVSDESKLRQFQPHRGDSLRDDGPVSLEYALRKFQSFKINK